MTFEQERTQTVEECLDALTEAIHALPVTALAYDIEFKLTELRDALRPWLKELGRR